MQTATLLPPQSYVTNSHKIRTSKHANKIVDQVVNDAELKRLNKA
jgi:hypothetical protein